MGSRTPERALALRQPEGFELCRSTVRAGTHEHEVPIVRDENLPVPPPVAGNLFALRRHPRVVARALDFNDTARRELARKRFSRRSLLELVRREQPAVRDPSAPIAEVDHATNAGPQRVTNGVQQIRQWDVVGCLSNGRTSRANLGEVTQISFERVHYGRQGTGWILASAGNTNP
jgi:hypothetical protein